MAEQESKELALKMERLFADFDTIKRIIDTLLVLKAKMREENEFLVKLFDDELKAKREKELHDTDNQKKIDGIKEQRDKAKERLES